MMFWQAVKVKPFATCVGTTALQATRGGLLGGVQEPGGKMLPGTRAPPSWPPLGQTDEWSTTPAKLAIGEERQSID